MLWQNVEHFVVSKELAETGTEGSGRFILGNVGIELDKIDLAYPGIGAGCPG